MLMIKNSLSGFFFHIFFAPTSSRDKPPVEQQNINVHKCHFISMIINDINVLFFFKFEEGEHREESY